MTPVLIAQFLSALADNALLFAAIAMLMAGHAPSWQTPALQAAFVIAFIFMAPFVGTVADAWPKGRVMLAANLMKLGGAASMLLGLHPLIAYNLVGIGAAAYSPAKYGILSELVDSDKLVKANGMMEGSTIVAILLGAVAGGKLASQSPQIALMIVCGCYLAAAIANLMVRKLPAAHPDSSICPARLFKDFFLATKQLFSNQDARFSLVGTSVFWGAGSTLRMMLVAWVPVALGIADLTMPANLSGAVAVGIAVGAALAASFISLDKVNRALPAGILIGLAIIVFAHMTHLYAAIAMLALIGACGGLYVVPLNALLQERGHETVGAGHAIAVQNFVENAVMLILVGTYTAMEKNGVPVITSATVFGGIILVAISTLAAFRLKTKK